MRQENSLAGWLFRVAMGAKDSPLHPWQWDHLFSQKCLDRTCDQGACARREAICDFEFWYLNEVCET